MVKGERAMDKGRTISISRRILLLIRRTKLLIVLRIIDIVMKTMDNVFFRQKNRRDISLDINKNIMSPRITCICSY